MEKKDVEPKSDGFSVDIGLGELAEAISGATDLAKPIVDKSLGLLGSLLGPGVKELGLTGGELVHRWRTKNRIETFAQVDRLLKERNVNPKILARGFLLPAFEAIGYCEEPQLQKLWAELLASAVIDKRASHPVYLDSLKCLSVEDARNFLTICEKGSVIIGRDLTKLERSFFLGPLVRLPDDAFLSVEILRSIGLIQFATFEILVALTSLGMVFASAIGVMPSEPVKVLTLDERRAHGLNYDEPKLDFQATH